MATIAIRNGNTGAVTAAGSPLSVLQAIQAGSDILVDGQTATLTNMGGNWFVNGVPVASLFTVATGPTTAPPDTHLPPPQFVAIECVPGFVPAPDGSMNCVDPSTVPPSPLPPGSVHSPMMHTDPFPVTAAGSLNLTPGTLVIAAIAAYFLFFRRSS